MAKRTYVTKQRLSHDGVDLLPNSPVEMDEARAASLLKDGVIELASAPKKGGGKGPGKGTGAAEGEGAGEGEGSGEGAGDSAGEGGKE